MGCFGRDGISSFFSLHNKYVSVFGLRMTFINACTTGNPFLCDKITRNLYREGFGDATMVLKWWASGEKKRCMHLYLIVGRVFSSICSHVYERSTLTLCRSHVGWQWKNMYLWWKIYRVLAASLRWVVCLCNLRRCSSWCSRVFTSVL